MLKHYSRAEKEAAFTKIIDQHYRSIYYYCYKKLNRDADEAKDCAQEVFFTFYKKIDSLKDFDKIGKWLYTTADHCIQRTLLKKSKENKKITFSITEKDPEHIPDCYSPFFSYEENLDLLFDSKIDIEEYKNRILSVLLPEEMTLWYLFFIEEKSQQEIADLMRLSLPAVKSRVLRLKYKLQKQIEILLRDEES